MQFELENHRDRLEAAGYVVDAPELRGQQFSAQDLGPMMPGVVGMIAGDDELNRKFFETASDLRVLIRWGIGMDSVDHGAAKDHSVVVRNTPAVFGGEVADSAMAYVLMLARGHHLVDAAVRGGSWPKREGISLAGSVMGVVGLGDIGVQVTRRALGFGMKVRGYDPYVSGESIPSEVQVCNELESLLQEAAFVVLTCPLTDETYHLINEWTLAQMRRDAYLINVARGPVVDEVALIDALSAGGIAGAGLDVFEVEPLPASSALRDLPSVVLGAHNGSNTREGVARASNQAVTTLLEELGAK